RLQQLRRSRPGRKRRHSLRAPRGKDRHSHASGNGQDPRSARSHHPPRPFWSGRRLPKDSRRSRPEIWRHPRARPPNPEHRPQETPENDREDGDDEDLNRLAAATDLTQSNRPPPQHQIGPVALYCFLNGGLREVRAGILTICLPFLCLKMKEVMERVRTSHLTQFREKSASKFDRFLTFS